ARQKTDEIVWIGPLHRAAAAQRVIEVRLVKQAEPPGKVDALADTGKIADGVDDFLSHRRDARADIAPRLEMIGVKIDQRADFHFGETVAQFRDQRREARHQRFCSVMRNFVSTTSLNRSASSCDTTQSRPCRSI